MPSLLEAVRAGAHSRRTCQVWFSLAAAACLLVLPACGGGGDGGSGGGGAAPGAPAPQPVPTPAVLQLAFDVTRNAGLPGGTVFEAIAGDVRCAAGFVHTVQSRTYANQNDLEFWCREGAGAPLQFRSIGKPSAGQYTSSIANLNGNLYEQIGKSVYENGAWRSLRAGELPIPSDAFPLAVLRREAETFVFSIYGSACEGISLHSSRGYHGTYREADWASSSALWTDGNSVALNIGNQIKVGPVPPPTTATCVSLPVSPDSSQPPVYAYAMMNLAGGLLYGPSLDDLTACTKLVELNLSTRQTRNIPLNACPPGYVTEVYSLTPWRNEILVGTFYVGRLYAFSPAGNSTRLTTWGMPRADDLPDPTWGGPYRESQSVVVSGGRVMMGMYPWSELFIQDSESAAPTIQRLLTQPAKGTEFAPYATRLAAASGVPHGPYEDRAWAQRIPTIAVLSGRVCASTGNRSGDDLQNWASAISAAEARPYGEVFCADVPNHVMGRPALEGRLQFRVTSQTISIIQNNVVLVEAPHTLSANALARLAAPTVTTAQGDYGPFAGTLSAVQ
ncbi:MAG: hypothetical protein ABUL43_00125 [Hyphomicrobium sp.]